jgi:hypothetical protein
MDKETKDSIANKAFQLMTEEKPNPTDNIYLSKATKKYVSAVNEVYDDKTNTTLNLMNGVVKETTLALERMLDDAVNITPGNYTRIINTILDTTYTENDFKAVIEKHVLAAREDLKKYIEETRQEKRRLTNAEEMRKELDEAKEAFEKLKHPKVKETTDPVEEKKLSFFERIKRLFCCKKCKKQ